MGANAAIYITGADSVDLASIFSDVVSDQARPPTWFDVKIGNDTVRFTVMPKAEVAGHIAGFLRYIPRMDTDESRVRHVSTGVSQTKCVLGLGTDREFEDNPAIWKSLFTIAEKYWGLILAYDSIILWNGVVAVGPLRHQGEAARGQSTAEHATGEAEARKARSIATLKREGVPFIAHLPAIETADQARFRSAPEIVRRLVALMIVALKGEAGEQPIIHDVRQRLAADSFFTPKERQFIDDPAPSQLDRIQAAWRYECGWVCLWAVGLVNELSRPDRICDVPKAVEIVRNLGTDGLLARAQPRPGAELLDAADLIYRYHWAVRDAGTRHQSAPAGLNAGVVMERHHALNWLIGYLDLDWDDVTTDT